MLADRNTLACPPAGLARISRLLLVILVITVCGANIAAENSAGTEGNIELARNYLQSGQFRPALIMLEKAYSQAPDDVKLNSELAALYYRYGNAAEALSAAYRLYERIESPQQELLPAELHTWLRILTLDQSDVRLKALLADLPLSSVNKKAYLAEYSLNKGEACDCTELANFLETTREGDTPGYYLRYLLARNELVQGNQAAALEWLDLKLPENANDYPVAVVDALLIAAQIALSQQNFVVAERYYKDSLAMLGDLDVITTRRYQALLGLTQALSTQERIVEAFLYTDFIRYAAQGKEREMVRKGVAAFRSGDAQQGESLLAALSASAHRATASILFQALIAHHAGQQIEARQKLSQLPSRGMNRIVQRMVAGMLLVTGNPDIALKNIKSLLDKGSEPYDWFVAGQVYNATGRDVLAEYWLEKAARTRLDNKMIRLGYVNWLQQQGQRSKASRWLFERLREQSNYRPWLQRYTRLAIELDQIESAIEMLSPTAEKNADVLWMLAILNSELGDWQKTLYLAELALDRLPEDKDLIAGISQILARALDQLAKSRQWVLADKTVDMLLIAEPLEKKWLKRKLGLVLNQKKYPHARNLVKSWTQIGESERADFSGSIEFAQENFDQAHRHYQAAWQNLKNMSLAMRLLQVKKRLGEKDPISHIRLWVKNDPESPEALLVMAMAAQRIADSRLAIDSYRALIAKEPTQAVAHNNLSWLYADQKRLDLALSHARKAVELKPQSAEMLDTLAWMYYLNQKFSQAEHWIKKALLIAPENTDILKHRKLIEGSLDTTKN